MNVYIKGMEMPVSCSDCKIRLSVGCCGNLPQNTRMPNCPLVPVPKHGDLIDRDVLLKECDKMEKSMDDHGREFSFSFMSSGDVCTAWYNVEIMIEDMPTIIEAEEGE